jgi:hypothetical protein
MGELISDSFVQKGQESLSYDDIVKRSIQVAKKNKNKGKSSKIATDDEGNAPNADQQVDITE